MLHQEEPMKINATKIICLKLGLFWSTGQDIQQFLKNNLNMTKILGMAPVNIGMCADQNHNRKQ